MQRYNRQLRYHAFGEDGQTALSNATILILGAGALGSHVAELLARMGAHHLAIVDMDIVELSNLHRQALYTEDMLIIWSLKFTQLNKRLNTLIQM